MRRLARDGLLTVLLVFALVFPDTDIVLPDTDRLFLRVMTSSPDGGPPLSGVF